MEESQGRGIKACRVPVPGLTHRNSPGPHHPPGQATEVLSLTETEAGTESLVYLAKLTASPWWSLNVNQGSEAAKPIPKPALAVASVGGQAGTVPLLSAVVQKSPL